MFPKYGLSLSMLLLLVCQSISALTPLPHACLSCDDVTNANTCTTLKTCLISEICSVTVNVGNDGIRYTYGCTQKNKCNTEAPHITSGGHIIGKRDTNNYQQLCFACCEGNVCNRQDCWALKKVWKNETSVIGTTSATMSVSMSSLITTEKTSSVSPASTKAPLEPTSCYLCTGPTFICEALKAPRKCNDASQQYCLNILENHADGSRTVDRRCANESECRSLWWDRTSDRSECSGFDPAAFTAKRFQCTYCCQGPNCNADLIPRSLWAPQPRKRYG